MLDFSLENIEVTENSLFTESEVIQFLQEIYILLNVEPLEFIGDERLGMINLRQVLYKRSIRGELLIRTLREQINLHCEYADTFEFDIEINYMKGNVRDIILLDIIVYDESGKPIKQQYIYK